MRPGGRTAPSGDVPISSKPARVASGASTGWALEPIHLKHELLPETIANAVAEAIANRQFGAGERVVETTLAAQMNVSRVPVREALKILHTQGIIEGGSHKGFRVASFSPHMVHSVQEARLEVETLLLRDAIGNSKKGDGFIPALDSVIAHMGHLARSGDFPGILRADLEFHRVICDFAQNPLFATLWNAIARHVLIILNLARYRDTDLHIVQRRHQTLRDKIKRHVGKSLPVEDLRQLLASHFQFDRIPKVPLPDMASKSATSKSVASKSATSKSVASKAALSKSTVPASLKPLPKVPAMGAIAPLKPKAGTAPATRTVGATAKGRLGSGKRTRSAQGQPASQPPSTLRQDPVVKLDSSLAR